MKYSGIYSPHADVVCPLQHVSVTAAISDTLAETKVTQTYRHLGQGSLEVFYTFPLPPKAMVSSFTARVGDAVVSAELKEKRAAREIYRKAVAKGDSGFLLERHREDIFQVTLGRVEPNEQITIEISYIEEVTLVDGSIRWVLPTVVAPRYIPDAPQVSSEGPGTARPNIRVPDADYITPPVGDAEYTLNFSAEISLPGGVSSVSSPSHALSAAVGEQGRTTVTLGSSLEKLDRDLVLMCLPKSETVSTAQMGSTPQGEFVHIRITPELPSLCAEKAAREYIFLLDISGSMSGEKLTQAKHALRIGLRNLEHGDMFNVIAFESRFSLFKTTPVPYTQDTLDNADSWINRLSSTGGTEIYEPLHHVLQQRTERERIVFLFTDGQVGNESEVISMVRQFSKGLSMFAFGIDTAVNMAFIDGVAAAGNGMAEYVYPGERIDDKIIRSFARLDEPHLTGTALHLDNGKLLTSVSALPVRLHSGDRYSFVAKLPSDYSPSSVTLKGTCAGDPVSFVLPLEPAGNPRLLALSYARQRLQEIENQIELASESRETKLRREAVALSLDYGLLSSFTSLVATLERPEALTGELVRQVVPVSLPHLWEGDYGHHDLLQSSTAHHRLAQPSSMQLCLRTGSLYGRAITEPDFMAYEAAPERDGTTSLIQTAILCQNADGSLGARVTAVDDTAKFVLGCLHAGVDIRAYRKQLRKAGLYLLRSGQYDMEVATALEGLANAKILKPQEIQQALETASSSQRVAVGEFTFRYIGALDEEERREVAQSLLRGLRCLQDR